MFETPIHWVADIPPHRVGLMARPRGNEDLRDDIQFWRAAGVDVVVSLLESAEVRELGLKEEGACCAEHQIEFLSFPMADRGTPASMREFTRFVDRLHQALCAGRSVAIHCRAGIGRTGLVAGCLLHRLGVPPDHVFPLLSRSRGVPMPDTLAQAAWVGTYAADQGPTT